jgi:hypothetical protein
MSRPELVAIIKGWYLGRGLGLVNHPAQIASTDPVQVFDLRTGEWREFNARLLTSRDQYRDGYDWLPGVLEGHTLAIVNAVNDPSFTALRPYQALRRIFDEGVQPAIGSTTSGERLIADWATSGTWPSRVPSQIHVVASAPADAAARAAALKGWLTQVRDHISTRFLTSPTGPGRLSERRTLVPSTHVLDDLSMFAEIALVTHAALDELIASVDRGLAIALPGEEDYAVPQV